MRRTRRFNPVTGWLVIPCVAVALLAGAAAAHAGTIIVPPRPGQVGIGFDPLQYGTLLNTGEFGKGFGSGPGLGFKLRYRMRYERGFGLTFERHTFDVRPGAEFRDQTLDEFTNLPVDTLLAESAAAYPKSLNLDLYGVEFYQMFDTRTKTTKILSVGAGIAHPSRKDNDGEFEFPIGDGFFLSAGGSVERFVWASLAFDVSVRYHAIFHEASTNHDLQASIGLMWYASL